MKNKKEMLRKVKALLLAGTMSATLSGCSVNVDDDLLKQFGINVTIKTDENGNVIGGDITAGEESKEVVVTTATTATTEYVVDSTTVATLPNIVTVPPIFTNNPTVVNTDQIVTDATESTTTTTVQIEKPRNNQKIDFGYVGMDSWLVPGDFEVVDEIREFRLSEETPTPWSLASKYHSAGESTMQFLDRIKKLNEVEDEKYPYVLKVPVKSIYYTGDNTLSMITAFTDVSVDEVCKINNIEYYDGIRFENNEKGRKLLVKILPEGTTSYEHSDGKKTYIRGNAIIRSDDLIDVERTYSDEYISACIEFTKETPFLRPCFFTQIQSDGTYVRTLVAYNPERVYLLDGTPVFEARDEGTSYVYGLANKQDACMFTTAATTMQPESYYFYKDPNGRVCFTFDSTDLTKYGYTRVDELKDKYVKYPEAYMQSPEQFDVNSKIK